MTWWRRMIERWRAGREYRRAKDILRYPLNYPMDDVRWAERYMEHRDG